MIYFIVITLYVAFGIMVAYGWNRAIPGAKGSSAWNKVGTYVTDMLFWPELMLFSASREYVYAGWSDDPRRTVDELLDAGLL